MQEVLGSVAHPVAQKPRATGAVALPFTLFLPYPCPSSKAKQRDAPAARFSR